MHPSVLRLIVAIGCISAFFLSARGEIPTVSRAAPAAWVQPTAVDLSVAKPLEQVERGRYTLIIERQVNPVEASRYTHIAKQFLSESAVEEGAKLTVGFDPAYESLSINQLTIHRGGNAIDRLPNQEIKVLQREDRLDWHLYDGRFSAVMILEDVRKDDVLEWAYTIRGRNPIFAGHSLETFGQGRNEPVQRLRFRLLWPSGQRPGIRFHGVPIEPEITPHGEVTEYDWDRRDVAAVFSDDEVPSWFDPWDWIQISDFQSWGAVVEWAMGLYKVPQEIPSELQDEVRRIAAEGTKEVQVMMALRYVQDNVRYLGMEIGENSHRPYPIETILSRRFGDCKDKALLLCTMLRRLGMESWPALVSSEGGHGAAESLPSPLAFDHAIVQLRLNGTEYWLDATDRDQGGQLHQLYTPPYGHALVLAPSTTTLSTVRPMGVETASKDEIESLEFPNLQGTASLRVHTIWRGHEADIIRSNLADNSLDAIQKSNLNYYAQIYPKVEAERLPKYQDDRAENVIVCDEAYQVSDFWKNIPTEVNRLKGEFFSRTIRTLLTRPATSIRTMPFALRFPNRITHTIEIKLPRSMNFKQEKTRIDDPSFAFAYKVVSAGASLSLRYSYEANRDQVPSSEISQYLASINQARELTSYEISFPKSWTQSAAPLIATSFDSPDWRNDAAAESPVSRWPILALIVIALGFVGGCAYWLIRRRRDASVVPLQIVHQCVVCGKTDQSDPTLEFRVGVDGEDYCRQHLPARRSSA